LNKIDLSSEQQRNETEVAIQSINPSATVLPSIRGQVDLSSILNVHAFDARPLDLEPTGQAPDQHDHAADEDCHCINHYEVRGISSLSLACPPLDTARLERLDHWIRTVLWEGQLPGASENSAKLEVLRCKGLFSVNGQQHVLQGVRSIYDIAPLAGSAPPSSSTGKLVFIGRHLHEEAVRTSLADVIWKST
jgi:G3E family GTPase